MNIVALAIVKRYGEGTDSDVTDAMVVNALDRKGGGADDNDAQAGHLVAGTVRSHTRPGSNDVGGIVSHTLRAEGFDASEDGTGRGTPLTVDPLVSRSSRGKPTPLSPGHNTDSHIALVSDARDIFQGYADASETYAGEVLRALRDETGEEAFALWGAGILAPLRSPEVLQSVLRGSGTQRGTEDLPESQDGAAVCERDGASWAMQSVRQAERIGCSSSQREPARQLAGELGTHLSELPCEASPAETLLLGLWQASEGLGLLREAFATVQKVGRSLDRQTQPAHASSAPSVGEEGGPGLVRRLTPSLSECEQLQGFPRGWTLLEPDTDWRTYPQPDGRRYAACGDAVTVNVSEWIGRRLVQAVEQGRDQAVETAEMPEAAA